MSRGVVSGPANPGDKPGHFGYNISSISRGAPLVYQCNKLIERARALGEERESNLAPNGKNGSGKNEQKGNE